MLAINAKVIIYGTENQTNTITGIDQTAIILLHLRATLGYILFSLVPSSGLVEIIPSSSEKPNIDVSLQYVYYSIKYADKYDWYQYYWHNFIRGPF